MGFTASLLAASGSGFPLLVYKLYKVVYYHKVIYRVVCKLVCKVLYNLYKGHCAFLGFNSTLLTLLHYTFPIVFVFVVVCVAPCAACSPRVDR